MYANDKLIINFPSKHIRNDLPRAKIWAMHTFYIRHDMFCNLYVVLYLYVYVVLYL